MDTRVDGYRGGMEELGRGSAEQVLVKMCDRFEKVGFLKKARARMVTRPNAQS